MILYLPFNYEIKLTNRYDKNGEFHRKVKVT